jgi:hypothetical protein
MILFADQTSMPYYRESAVLGSFAGCKTEETR